MPEENGAHKEPYVSKSFSKGFFGGPRKKELNLTEEEIDGLIDTFENKLVLKDDDHYEELSDEEIVEEVQHETREKVLPPHLTYGIPDKDFQKPMSETFKFPKGITAFAGNESGSIEAKFTTGDTHATTDIGVNHHKNEDGIFIDEESNTIVLTDGIGSSGSGEVASSIAAYGTSKLLKDSRDKKTPAYPLRDMPTILHRAVLEYQKHNGPRFKDCSATLAAARLNKQNKTVEFVHVGDSKALLIRNGELVYSSQDDNLLTYMMINRDMTKSEAEDLLLDLNTDSSSVIQSLGHDSNAVNLKTGKTSSDSTNPHHTILKVQKGDVVLLCSDGLSDTLSPQQIAAYVQGNLREGGSVKEMVESLKKETIELMKNGRGKPDNISIAATVIE